MTADDIRSAIAGIKAEEKAVQKTMKGLPHGRFTAGYDNLYARGLALASQREHLEGLLKETANLNMGGDLPPRRRYP